MASPKSFNGTSDAVVIGRHIIIKKNKNVFAELIDAKYILGEIKLLMTLKTHLFILLVYSIHVSKAIITAMMLQMESIIASFVYLYIAVRHWCLNKLNKYGPKATETIEDLHLDVFRIK